MVTSVARAAIAALVMGSTVACGTAGRDLGESCAITSECASALQCLDHVCVPRCTSHLDCGDGAICDDGECQLVTSEIGDVCASELECGLGQTCRLPPTFGADSTCQAEHLGALEGERCAVDDDCRNGGCALGRCIGLCQHNSDCRRGWLCAKIPHPPLGFDGCLPGNATIEFEVPVARDPQDTTDPNRDLDVSVPVPSTARSMVLLFESRMLDAASQFVGAGLVKNPRGVTVYRQPLDTTDYFSNPVRHAPLPALSVMEVPSSSAAPLEAGLYTVSVTRYRLNQDPQVVRDNGPLPRLRVVQKLGSGSVLDLHFYFRDLTDHPCAAAIGGDLSAATAATLGGFQQQFLPELARIFELANIRLGQVTYTDLDGIRPEDQRHEYDVLQASQAGELFRQATTTTGVPIFFVRSIEPEGNQLLTGGTPGVPIPGTGASGIAVALDSLCYREWTELARQTAHGVARHMGLFRNREPDGLPGHTDPITDSDDGMDNLMHWSEFGGTDLSIGQREILRASPVLR